MKPRWRNAGGVFLWEGAQNAERRTQNAERRTQNAGAQERRNTGGTNTKARSYQY
ncbi:MAG: hypothetical protein HWD92_11105 [Flavobacteriia bacterium]|nr:hypothetical protein [Flavobacteriia bacterium]